MTTEKTELSQLRYNAATQRFEAMVAFKGATGTQKFPCELYATINTPFEVISKGLVADAERQKSGGRAQLMSHSPEVSVLRSLFTTPRLGVDTTLLWQDRQSAA